MEGCPRLVARSPLPESPLPNALGIAADSLFFIAHSPPLGVGGRAIKKSYERIARPFSGNAQVKICLEQRATGFLSILESPLPESPQP